MANVDKLKKRAADFEAKRQMDKAIATYLEIFQAWNEDGGAEADVALYNRVGDMLLRDGNVGDAMSVWETAVDYYADRGMHNNAIALCNKILRHSPGRTSVYYKLGKYSAMRGFRGDAKKNFLEYADRMQKAQQIDEAFRALKEFADLCPDEDEIRQMLADQLARLGRNEEALEQLQHLYERYETIGQSAEAAATVERMKAIDPAVEPKRSGPSRAREASGLVFLDLNEPVARPSRRSIVTPPPSKRVSKSPPPPSLGGLPLIDIDEPEPAVPPVAGLEPTAAEPPVEVPAPPPTAEVKDITFGASFGTDEATAAEAEPLQGFEPTSFEAPPGEEVSAALSTPEDVTFGTSALDDVQAGELTEPGGDSPFGTLGLEPTAADMPDDVPALPPLDIVPEFMVEPPDADFRADAEVAKIAEAIDDEIDAEFSMDTPAGASDGIETDIGAAVADELNLELDAGVDTGLDAELDVDVVDRETAVTPSESEPVPDDQAAVESTAGPIAEAPRRKTRSTLSILAQSVDGLRRRVAEETENWQLKRELGEALLEDGDREGGLAELEASMVGFERSDDLDSARSVAEEIILLNPHSVRHHQKRVEYAFRMNDSSRVVDAYRDLADALFRDGQTEKSRAVYHRVLELAPGDERAQAALDAFSPPPPSQPEPPREEPARAVPARRYTAATPMTTEAVPPAPRPEPKPASDDFVDLQDWLREDEAPKSTRMIVEEQQPTGDEDADFSDMLRKFKQGVAENVDEEDFDSHYDLGVAYKEMGLVDEAIAEFQKALRGTANRVRAYEALGQCFVEKGQAAVAMTILQRALSEPGVGDDQLVGVLYLLGNSAEALAQPTNAVTYYQRVFAVDINFRDVQQRMRMLEPGKS